MIIVIREGDLMVEIQAHEDQPPTICASLNGQHLTAMFRWDYDGFDDLHSAVRFILDGVRPQVMA